ncbi:MAG TPA: hypothetical protein VMF13_07270 [Luteitalea sp.]|nr:hypothetical protein [Luteitalea sp.]
MPFSLVCLLGTVTTVPFGLAFLLAPEATGALYGVSGWTAGTALIARLFGVALVHSAGAFVAARHTTDARLQRSMSTFFALAAAIAVIVSLQAVLASAVNALGYSTVGIYAFFTVAWASIALRKAA